MLLEDLRTGAQQQDRSVSDYIRALLCDYYELVCDPSDSSSRWQGGPAGGQMLLRLQPELHAAIAHDAGTRRATMNSRILWVLETHKVEFVTS